MEHTSMRNEKLRAELWKGVASEIRLVNPEMVNTAIVKVIATLAGRLDRPPSANEAIDDFIAESQKLFP